MKAQAALSTVRAHLLIYALSPADTGLIHNLLDMRFALIKVPLGVPWQASFYLAKTCLSYVHMLLFALTILSIVLRKCERNCVECVTEIVI